MPIPGVTQPETIEVSNDIRLRKYDGNYDFAFSWYQDKELVYLVDGDRSPYDMDRLSRMYSYLDAHGELYFIEAKEDGAYRPIGDVTFWQDDMPIVIGDSKYRGRGIGRLVISRLIERGRELGFGRLNVREIYSYNIASQRAFESCGFVRDAETENGFSYYIDLTERKGNMHASENS